MRPPDDPTPGPSIAGRRLDVVRDAVRDAVAVLLPVVCAGCGAPDRSVCDGCLVALTPRPHRAERAAVSAWAALEYGGAVAGVVAAFKDGGRTDVVRPLGIALRAAVVAALGAVDAVGKPARSPSSGSAGTRPGIELCTVPSTAAAWHARGFAPVERLLGATGLRGARVLRIGRAKADQAALDADARRRNVHGSLAAVRRLEGRRFLLVDDVCTTGATLEEARRALMAGGADVVGAAVVAQTPRRSERPTTHDRAEETSVIAPMDGS